ncbi:MAG: galactose-1-epimerase, partial [Alistipes sp.]|nr:galactose-1-epimerase [Alistipes sp.]
MKHLLCCALVGLLAGCRQAPKEEIALLPASAFEATIDGRPVGLYTLRAGDLCMQVTNYGARVVTLWTPDREGSLDDIVLGY